MELALHNFSSWDDWDDDWGFDNGSDSNSRYGNVPSSPSDDYGTRGTGGRTPVPSHQDREDPDVFIIRSVSENPLTGVSALSKIIRGIPFSANNQINVSLQRSGNLGHGGGVINGIIFGKIEKQSIGQGMRVKISGKRRRGCFIIRKMWDVDGNNQQITINHYWRDPLYQGNRTRGNASRFSALIVLLVLIALIALIFHFTGGIGGNLLNTIKWIAIIAAVLLFIKVFNINIFNNPTVQKVILFVVLVAVALYVPGGDSLMVAAIMLFGLYLLVKSIVR